MAELESAGVDMKHAGPVANSTLRDAVVYEFIPAAEQTFVVSCWIWSDSAQVNFDAWHETFGDNEDPADVVKLVAFGLSDRCRMTVNLAGGCPHRWRLWVQHDGEWSLYSETGLMFYRWLGKRSKQELQNHVLPWNERLWEPGDVEPQADP